MMLKGTRLHQITRNSITRRAAAFENLIRKFNQHVTYLEEHHKPSYQVPVPSRLPTQLQSLRDMETSHLWEDVWISKTETPPRWLVDEDIRKGIRSFLNLDRCAEERARLNTEATNLLSWFTGELHALTFMVRSSQYARYRTILTSRLQDHIQLARSWSTPFVQATMFQEQIASAARWVSHLSVAHISESFIPAPSLPPHPRPSPPTLSSQLASSPTSALPSSIRPSPTAHTQSPITVPQAGHLDTLLTVEEDGSDDDEDDEIVITGERLALTDVMVDSELDDTEETMPFEWMPPASLRTDAILFAAIKGHRFPPFNHTAQLARSFRNLAGVQYTFNLSQYKRLDSSTQWLDDECINGCGALLEQSFRVSGAGCAIFSTYVIQEVVKNSARTETAWRIACPTKYWAQSVWVLPIHDQEEHHWALAVVRVEEEQIQLFDSFGSRDFLSRWLPKVQAAFYLAIMLINLVSAATSSAPGAEQRL
ncbi:hypothetical protein PQX77_020404 [Marasmius sp. AFHP31]|nr:hypothetical protein PQX77_020404 [Marasmius sp. AFHP31]